MFRIIAVLAALLTLAGCPLLKSQTKSSSVPQLERQTLSVTIPKLTTLGKTEAAQIKGAVTVAVSTTPFKAKRKSCKRYRQLPAGFVVNEQYPYEVRTEPVAVVSPQNLVFKVQVINNLDQVMRLAGTLIRFQVDGAELTLEDKSGLKSFLDGVLAPREQREFTITGPSISALPRQANVALMLFGIVTETDAAGNPSKRENFEWFYRLEVEDKQVVGEVMIDEVKFNPSSVPPSTCR